MGIQTELANLLEYGDYTLIKALYDERHSTGDEADHKTVSVEYVKLVVTGKRVTKREGTVADEVLRIAEKYLKHKADFRLNIQAI